MRLPRIRTALVVVFVIAAAIGAVGAIVMPESWTNLESSPPFMAWLIAPAFLAFLGLCLATFTDFISNDGANPHWLDALWIMSVALVTGTYGMLASAVATRLKQILGRAHDE